MGVKQLNNAHLYSVLFYIGFTVLLANKYAKIIKILTSSLLATNLVYLAGIVLVILSILFKRFSIIDILLVGYGFYSFIVARDGTLLSFIVLIVAVKNLNVDDIIGIYVRFQTIVLGICIILYPLLLMAGSSYATTSNIAGRFRYSFFFSHPNNFAIQCVFTVLAYLYVKRNSLSYCKVNIILLVATIFLYVFPNSQTATIALVVYMLIQFMIRYARLLWKPFIKIVLPFIIVVISVIVYMYYTGKAAVISSYLSKTFGARFSGAAMAFFLYKVNLFGNYLENLGKTLYVNGQWNSFWFDLAYIRILFAFGIVGTVIFYYILLMNVKKYIQERNYYVLSLLVVVMVYGLSEWTAFSILTVFPLLFFNVSLQSRNKAFRFRKMHITLGKIGGIRL